MDGFLFCASQQVCLPSVWQNLKTYFSVPYILAVKLLLGWFLHLQNAHCKVNDLANSVYNLLIYGNYFFISFALFFLLAQTITFVTYRENLNKKKSLFSVEQKPSTNLPEWKCKSFLVSWEHWPYYIYCLLKRKWFFFTCGWVI